eukprot:TRINITY_DN2418_c3_g1_i1.p1 TRINITY_DN2418_c3_g1~~TRINITY_DN2418_c3_g1_i1.p1  ORF type:complete len:630 (+),score=45.95 TRINITY_DN2418_c3_g1_i1:621-2510(+)
MVYSYNWIVGSVVIGTGLLIWVVVFIATYIHTVTPPALWIPVMNFFVGIWVIPLLMYWSEKKARHNAFLQWCNLKVSLLCSTKPLQELKRWRKLLNNLPVGVLVYKRSTLSFASLTAHKLLVDEEEPDLLRVETAISHNSQLREAIETAEGQRITQISPSNEPKPLSINTIVLGLQDEPYKVCILQDQSLYAELEKEKAAKEYTKKFFAMITHELRNPLQGVLGIFESLLEFLRGEKGESEQCRMGISTVKLMMRLVNDLLDLTQIETGKFKLTNVLVEIKDVVCECVELMQFKFKSKGVSLIYQFIEPIPLISCDKNRYKQILLNLLGNAIKFTEQGSVTITVEYETESRRLITTVSDTGVGIKPEDQGQLFSFFGKLEDHQALNPQGAGLGLYICKKLSTAMGGEITLESEYLKGTTIQFSIKNMEEEPFLKVSVHSEEDWREAEADIMESPAPICRIPYSFAQPNFLLQPEVITTETRMEQKPVLVVDDEFICASVLKSYLTRHGIDADIVKFLHKTYTQATSGTQAVELVSDKLNEEGKGYRLIFMDLNMPVMGGEETTRNIKKLYRNTVPEPFIVGVSGDAESEIKDKCKAAGMDMLRISFYMYNVQQCRNLWVNPKCIKQLTN